MNPEEKFDRTIKNIIRIDLLDKPSPDFTDHVLGKLGVHKLSSRAVTKPILSKWAKLAIAVAYILLIGLLLVNTNSQPGMADKYLTLLPKFNLPSLDSIIDFKNPGYSLLAVFAGAAWLLILMDRVLKRYFLR